MSVALRPRKCRACRQLYKPQRPLQTVCSVPCAREQARKTAAKSQAAARRAERQKNRAAKARLLTRRDWIKRAQTAFNRYIRLRDAGRLCICCDRPLTLDAVGGGYDCGHYRSVGSAPHLRFHEDNAHAQTKQCNRYAAGRAVDYRMGLIKRIGLTRVEALEADQTIKKWTIPELQGIERHYKELAKGLS